MRHAGWWSVLAIVALLLGVSALAGPRPVVLTGSIWTEKPVQAVELRLWQRGEMAPSRVESLRPGQPFRIALEDLTPPLRLEAVTEGHLGAAFMLGGPDQAALPALWLPAARGIDVKVLRAGQPVAEALLGGSAGRLGGVEVELGRWFPVVPSVTSGPQGSARLWVPVHGPYVLSARDRDGRFGSSRGAAPGSDPRLVELRSTAVPVRVENARGEPVADVAVATGGMPVAAMTDAGGVAVVQAPPEGEWDVVAFGKGLVGRTRGRGGVVGPLVIRVEPPGALEVSWTGPRRIQVSSYDLPASLADSTPTVVTGGRGSLPWRGRGGIEAWAPGYSRASVRDVEPGTPVPLRFEPAARLTGRVVDEAGRPQAGVPVWSWLPPWQDDPGWSHHARDLRPPVLPWAVTARDGRFEIAGLHGGWQRLHACKDGFPPAEWGAEEVPSGGSRKMTLVLRRGTWLALQAVGSDGKPVPGVAVEVYHAPTNPSEMPPLSPLDARDGAPLASAVTGEDGTARLEPLAPAPVRVLLSARGFQPKLLEVAAPAEGANLGKVVLGSAITIAVRVVDEDGKGVPGARLGVAQSPREAGRTGGETDAEGRRTVIEQPREGNLYLTARARGFVPSAPVKVPLPPSDEVEIRLGRGRVLVGRVTNAETGKPVADAAVTAFVPFESRSGEPHFTLRPGVQGRTDERGEARLEGLEPGEVQVSAVARGFCSRRLAARLASQGEAQRIDIALSPGLEVRGRVVDAEELPIAGVRVSGRPIDGQGEDLEGPYPFFATTDAAGAFVVEGLTAGRWELRGRVGNNVLGGVTVTAGQCDVVLRLETPGALRCRVVGPDNDPVAGAEVRYGRHGGGGGGQGRSAADGTVLVKDLPAGTYQLAVTSSQDGQWEGPVSVEPGRTAEVEARLPGGGRIEGFVRGLSPAELTRCSVFAGGESARSGADGAFTAQGTRLGRVLVTALVEPDGRRCAAWVEVAAGTPAGVELDFADGLDVRGRVERSGSDVAGLLVQIGSALESALAVTDSQGRFELTGVRAGPREAKVRDATGRMLLEQTVEVGAGAELVLAVPSSRVRGCVVQAEGREGVAGARVELREPRGVRLRQTLSGQDGGFEFQAVAAGRYLLRATSADGAVALADVQMDAHDIEITLTIEAGPGLRLRVLRPDGRPASRVRVAVIRDEMPAGELLALADEEGRLALKELPAGRYLLHLACEEGSGTAVVVAALPGDERTVALRPTGWLTIEVPPFLTGNPWRVRVRDAASGLAMPLPVVSPVGFQRVVSWVPVTIGNLRVALPTGSYVVEAISPVGDEVSRAVTLSSSVGTVLGLP